MAATSPPLPLRGQVGGDIVHRFLLDDDVGVVALFVVVLASEVGVGVVDGVLLVRVNVGDVVDLPRMQVTADGGGAAHLVLPGEPLLPVVHALVGRVAAVDRQEAPDPAADLLLQPFALLGHGRHRDTVPVEVPSSGEGDIPVLMP